MNRTAAKNHPGIFFLLLFLLTLPEYALGLVPPYSVVMVLNPLLAASILTYHDEGFGGIVHLLKRSFDYSRIRRKTWYAPLLLLMPTTLILMYAWTRWTGVPMAGLQVPFLLLPPYFLVFIVLAIGEEVGWTGYALDPLQDRWGALPAGIILGAIWALWHLIPYALANPPLWVAGQCVTTVMLRILMVWLYNNTGKSVFGMILFHAMINLCTIPDYGFTYDPVLAGIILTGMAAFVVIFWDSRTLTRFRYARSSLPVS
jgi:CAAX amino terminal protease family.